MKYFITLLGGLLLLTGCSESPSFKIVTIDGCEYIEARYSGTITHKANCTNHVQKPVQLPPSEYPVAPLWPNLPPGFRGYAVTNLNLGVIDLTATNIYLHPTNKYWIMDKDKNLKPLEETK